MGTFYGIHPHIITSSDVNSITLVNSIIDSGNTGDIGSGYQLSINHTITDCSSTSVYLELKDNISWTKIAFDMVLTSTASCWGFNDDWGGGSKGNLLGYDESLGDVVLYNLNTWEVPLYQTHNKTAACDNDSSNFFTYAVNPKIFRMTRRRNINGSLSGITQIRACCTLGTTLIRRIRIW